MAPFQSCPRAYRWDFDLEADTNLTWNLLWVGGSSEPANPGRWGDIRGQSGDQAKFGAGGLLRHPTDTLGSHRSAVGKFIAGIWRGHVGVAS